MRRVKLDAMRAAARSGLADVRMLLRKKALPLGAFAAVLMVTGAAEVLTTGQISLTATLARKGAWVAFWGNPLC